MFLQKKFTLDQKKTILYKENILFVMLYTKKNIFEKNINFYFFIHRKKKDLGNWHTRLANTRKKNKF